MYSVKYSNEIDLNVMRTFDVKPESSLQNKTKLKKMEILFPYYRCKFNLGYQSIFRGDLRDSLEAASACGMMNLMMMIMTLKNTQL